MRNQFLLYGANGYTGKLIASFHQVPPLLVFPSPNEAPGRRLHGVRADGFAAEQSPTTQHAVPVNIFFQCKFFT